MRWTLVLLTSVIVAAASGTSTAATAVHSCGYVGSGQADLVRSTPDVSCVQARRVALKVNTARCFYPGTSTAHPCIVEGFSCRVAFHAAHDGAGFSITRCMRGRRLILGKTGP